MSSPALPKLPEQGRLDDESERALIGQLRHEAESVKDCFTRFTFHSMMLSAVAFGFMLDHMEQPFVTLSAIPTIVLLMAVSRIGIFKYDTANRNYGYELHLARIRRLAERLPESDPIRVKLERMRSVRWEEACRAWRIVQVSIFRLVYKTPETHAPWRWLRGGGTVALLLNALDPSLYNFTAELKREVRKYRRSYEDARKRDTLPRLDGDNPYPWFLPDLLTRLQDRRSVYYTGSYLKAMTLVLLLTQYLLLAPMAVLVLNSYLFKYSAPPPLQRPGIWALIVGVSALAITLRGIRVQRRRTILENELLSIHSWSIMWHYVIKTHLETLGSDQRAYRHYTERLARGCRLTLTDVLTIHSRLTEGQEPTAASPYPGEPPAEIVTDAG